MRVESRNGRGPSENPAASLLKVCEAVPKSGRRQLWQDTGALHSFDKLALDWLRMVAAMQRPVLHTNKAPARVQHTVSLYKPGPARVGFLAS